MLQITEEQALWFRASRSHLLGDGAETVAQAAGDILGAQAQVEGPALHALSLRTKGRPTAEEVKQSVYGAEPLLLRTWGQRDTLHLYALEDWNLSSNANLLWKQSGRKGGMPEESLVAEIESYISSLGRPFVRSDLFDQIPKSYVKSLKDHPGAGKTPERFAATRLIWVLARAGKLCFAGRKGREESYAHRSHWAPELAWEHREPSRAAVELTRRYFRVWGPATAADVAHYFGARVGTAREWVEALRDELLEVNCEERKGLYCHCEDKESLLKGPGAKWPLRILPAYDTQLMTHKDKRWILPNKAEEPLVWQRAAVVCATVLHRGRIVATWSHKKTKTKLSVRLQPLKAWKRSFMRDFKREIEDFRQHLGLSKLEFDRP